MSTVPLFQNKLTSWASGYNSRMWILGGRNSIHITSTWISAIRKDMVCGWWPLAVLHRSHSHAQQSTFLLSPWGPTTHPCQVLRILCPWLSPHVSSNDPLPTRETLAPSFASLRIFLYAPQPPCQPPLVIKMQLKMSHSGCYIIIPR